MNRLLVGFVTFLALVSGPSTRAASTAGDTVRGWQGPKGAIVEGRLLEVVGALALIGAKQGNAFLPMEHMSDADIQAVAAFAAARRKMSAPWTTSTSNVAKSLSGRLQRLENGELVEFKAGDRREPEIYLVYFSAAWCGPCQRFTPELLKAYERYQLQAPGRVEVIFVTNDHSAKEQLGYVKKVPMPWPVLRFSSRGQARAIERWEGKGIPCLVAVTRDGDVMAHSYHGDKYVGPGYVLEICDQLLDATVGTSLATKRGQHRLAVLEHVAAAENGGSRPKPFFVQLDPEKYRGISAAPVTVSLDIDERGRVRESRFGRDIGGDLERMLREDVEAWLFLPAVKDGKACAQTIAVPLVFGATRAAKADSAGGS